MRSSLLRSVIQSNKEESSTLSGMGAGKIKVKDQSKGVTGPVRFHIYLLKVLSCKKNS